MEIIRRTLLIICGSIVLFILYCLSIVKIYSGNDLVSYVYMNVNTVNIPYDLQVWYKVDNIYIYSPKYYPLLGVDTFIFKQAKGKEESIEAIDTIVAALWDVTQVQNRKDPRYVTLYGGDCQSIAITARYNLQRAGLINGYLTYSNHVANWADVGDNNYVLIDILNHNVRFLTREEVNEYIAEGIIHLE